MKPLCIDLYCGLGGWAEGFLAEGYDVIGFDIERHDYGTGGYPGQLVLQDVLTLHGSQFRNAACIVASPPCQAYSYRAMPWKRAKALPPPSNELLDACFRIQREACEAAGHHIPMVVENVCGAQRWVGRAKWHHGSYYLWGDVPGLMPQVGRTAMKRGVAHRSNGETNFHGSAARAANKVPGFRFDGSGRSFQTAAVNGIKQHGSGAAWFDKALDERRKAAGGLKNGGDWFGSGDNSSLQRKAGSRSNARKAASALIAKIPFDLARYIALVFKPVEQRVA